MTPASSSRPQRRRRPQRHTFGFRSVTLEEMHQFRLNFTEGSTIIKYRSNSKEEGVTREFLSELWPLLFT